MDGWQSQKINVNYSSLNEKIQARIHFRFNQNMATTSWSVTESYLPTSNECQPGTRIQMSVILGQEEMQLVKYFKCMWDAYIIITKIFFMLTQGT